MSPASNVGSWAADSIDFCADNDLVNGKSTYSFAPKDNLTRGQLVAILYRAAGLSLRHRHDEPV